MCVDRVAVPFANEPLQVRVIGDNAAVVSYIRLQQKLDSNGRPITIATEETRCGKKRTVVSGRMSTFTEALQLPAVRHARLMR